MQSPPCGTYEGIETKRVRSQDKDLKEEEKKKKGIKNIQQQVFAGGHPPNY
jgi:hypothetical protein